MGTLKLKISSFLSFLFLNTMAQEKLTDSGNAQTIWEAGVSCFLGEDDRGSIANFEKLLLIVDRNNPKYSAALFYIGHSYRVILKNEGLTKTEADRMIECYELYLDFPVTILNSETNKNVTAFLERKKKSRPVTQAAKWKDTTD